jgi:large subunit ribosomal protein L24
MSLRKGDVVMVIAGKDNGKTGKVLEILPGGERAIVEKINVVKRHTRPNQKQRQGGIVEKELSIHISNLMPYDEKTKKPSRIRNAVDNKGKKYRVYATSGEKVGS